MGLGLGRKKKRKTGNILEIGDETMNLRLDGTRG